MEVEKWRKLLNRQQRWRLCRFAARAKISGGGADDELGPTELSGAQRRRGYHQRLRRGGETLRLDRAAKERDRAQFVQGFPRGRQAVDDSRPSGTCEIPAGASIGSPKDSRLGDHAFLAGHVAMNREHLVACSAPDAIEALVAAWATAWNRHDIEAMARLVMPAVDFVNVEGRWLRGRDEFVDHHRQIHGEQMRDSAWTNLCRETRSIGNDLAIVHLEWTIEGDRDPVGTPRSPRHGLFTWVVCRTQNRWRIAAAHNTNLRPGMTHRLTPKVTR